MLAMLQGILRRHTHQVDKMYCVRVSEGAADAMRVRLFPP